MKKLLSLVILFSGVLLLSCGEHPLPPEEIEREANIRDSNFKEDAVERRQQKQAMKEALTDTLRQKNSDLLFYQETLADEKADLENSKEEMKKTQEAQARKSHADEDDHINNLALRIATLEGDIEKNVDKIMHTQEEVNKLKEQLQKYN